MVNINLFKVVQLNNQIIAQFTFTEISVECSQKVYARRAVQHPTLFPSQGPFNCRMNAARGFIPRENSSNPATKLHAIKSNLVDHSETTSTDNFSLRNAKLIDPRRKSNDNMTSRQPPPLSKKARAQPQKEKRYEKARRLLKEKKGGRQILASNVT